MFDEIAGDDSIIWTCPSCKIALPGIKKILVTLTQLQNKFTKMEEKLESIVLNQTNQVTDDNNNDVPCVERDSSVQEAVQKALLEEKEIEKRRLNLIVQALPEDEDDEGNVKKLINERLNCDIEIDRSNCTRLGKSSPEKPRPLRIVMKNFESKRKVLDASKQLKNDEEYSNVYISPDLTQNQRLQAFELREEKRRRERNGEKGLTIRSGRIVQLNVGGGNEHNYTRQRATGGAQGGGGGDSFRQ